MPTLTELGRPSKGETRAMSGDLYSQEYYEGKQPRGVLSLSNKALIRLILQRCDSRSSLLEMGCAKGAFLAALEPFFEELVGIDVSDYAISQRYKYVTKARSYRCDVEKEEQLKEMFKNQTFDVIVSLHTFEHLENPGGVLRTCLNLLKNDGYLFLVVPNPELWLGKVYALFGRKESCAVFEKTHKSLLTKKAWGHLLHQSGFHWEFKGRPFFVIKNRFLDKLYPFYYTSFLADTGFELLFICQKKGAGR